LDLFHLYVNDQGASKKGERITVPWKRFRRSCGKRSTRLSMVPLTVGFSCICEEHVDVKNESKMV
jgi:hypothetical protein